MFYLLQVAARTMSSWVHVNCLQKSSAVHAIRTRYAPPVCPLLAVVLTVLAGLRPRLMLVVHLEQRPSIARLMALVRGA
jgi:hypothetical protein